MVSAAVMSVDGIEKKLSVFTRLDKWSQLFVTAQEIAQGASPSELPPFGECRPEPKPPARPASR